jgi:hypothetical protein
MIDWYKETALEHALSGQHPFCDVETQCTASQQPDSCITGKDTSLIPLSLVH